MTVARIEQVPRDLFHPIAARIASEPENLYSTRPTGDTNSTVKKSIAAKAPRCVLEQDGAAL